MIRHQFRTSLASSLALVAALHGSSTHRLSVDVFLRHRDNGRGMCILCGCRVPCPAGWRAAAVIQAAGEDPRCYASLPAGEHTSDGARKVDQGYGRVAVPADVSGYRVGGVGRRADVPFFCYER